MAVDEARYTGIYAGAGDFFKDVGLVFVFGFEKAGELTLGQHRGAAELLEVETHDVTDVFLDVAHAAEFGAFWKKQIAPGLGIGAVAGDVGLPACCVPAPVFVFESQAH